MSKRILQLIWLVVLAGTVGCTPESAGPATYNLNLPNYAPTPQWGENNPMTVQSVELGKMLFFDKALSRDSTINCASCHFPEKAFTDGRKLSTGIRGQIVPRNAPALFNSLFGVSFFWDGGVPNLEMQALAPIQAHNEMDLTFPELIQRLSNDPVYVSKFQQAYGTGPTNAAVVRALANFQRSLVSFGSPYDRYFQGDTNALTASEKRGKDIFFGENAECFHCHTGSNFTDESYMNNGLYAVYADSGRARITNRSRDVGRFKVPTLRNIEMTAPYMHDGSLATLDDVLDHYTSGGKRHPNQSSLVRPFVLTPQEREDLKAFLRSLTDHAFLNDPRHRP